MSWSPASSLEASYDDVVIDTDSRGLIVKDVARIRPETLAKRTTHHISRHFSSPEKEPIAHLKKTERQGGRKKKKKEKKSAREKCKNESTTEETGMSEAKRIQSPVPITRSPRDLIETGMPQTRKVEKQTADHDESGLLQGQPSCALQQPQLAPWQQVLAAPASQQTATFERLLHGINIDDLSSDSTLTDVPEDIGSDPFQSSEEEQVSKKETQNHQRREPYIRPHKHKESIRVKKRGKNGMAASSVTPKQDGQTPKSKSRSLQKSPYFPHPHKHRPTFLSTLPFPPLHLERFGLMQERLCHDPFRLLLATIFLNKTPGSRAMPVFFRLMERYPTPGALAEAEQSDVTAIIQKLGFQNQRARKCISMAAVWVQDPPQRGRRRRKKDYPEKGAGRDLKDDEIVDDQDPRVAWEISHLPGLGPYSHDSWRMFCRDELRGLASSYNGEGTDAPFEPEWKRVCPTDKELRAWMTWSWMKEGWVWNKETGARSKASDELMELAKHEGNIILESERQTLSIHPLQQEVKVPGDMLLDAEDVGLRIDTPAGKYVPS